MSYTAIAIENLVKGFGSHVVLGGLNLEVQEGETLVVMGRSGCGKTVLLKLIIGLVKPDSGAILVDGLDVPTLKVKALAELRKRFGMVFQSSALFDSMTVEQNVGLALRKHSRLPEREIRGRIADSLRKVDLEGVDDLLPAELSGGMKKRVSLARAIATLPEFVLYDEPTAGLDPVTARSINKLIVRLKEGMSVTSVVVTHDVVSALQIGDRIALLHEGAIRSIGTPDEVLHTADPVVQQFVNGQTPAP